jgi:hypothetical protein
LKQRQLRTAEPLIQAHEREIRQAWQDHLGR